MATAGHIRDDAAHPEAVGPPPPLRPWEMLAIDAVGNVIEFWGFKHNHGRVWALLYLRDTTLRASDLQELLGLSKGAVSMLSRELEQWRVVRRVRDPGDSTWRFEANTQFMDMVRRVLESREKEFLARVSADLSRAEEELSRDPTASEEAAARVARMRVLAERTEATIRAFLATSKLDATPLFDALRETARRWRRRKSE